MTTAYLSDFDSALSLLQNHPDNMIIMDDNFSCWIRRGIRQDNVPLTATGHTIAEISKEVFKQLSVQMVASHWCSQYQQQ
jgi:hypothetical protein